LFFILKLLYLKIVIHANFKVCSFANGKTTPKAWKQTPSMAHIKKAVPKTDGVFARIMNILCEKSDITLFVLLVSNGGGGGGVIVSNGIFCIGDKVLMAIFWLIKLILPFSENLSRYQIPTASLLNYSLINE